MKIADEGIKILDREKAIMRAKRNKLFKLCLAIISHNAFHVFVSLCIVVNTGTLAFDKYPVD